MEDQLKNYRKRIEQIDARIFELLAARFEVVKAIGKHKKEYSLVIRSKKREEQLVEAAIKTSCLSPKFIKKLYKLIFKYSAKIEIIL